MKENLLTVDIVAHRLKVTPQYVRNLIRDNKLQAQRIGKQWVIDEERVQEFINSYNFVVEPDDHCRRSSDIPDFVAMSFFSGAMGLDIGMMNMGIEPVLACENNKYCRMTIDRNNNDIGLIGDINRYSVDDIYRMAGLPIGTHVDLIFGGPPCQAFSTAGKRKGLFDERGNVFLRFLDVIDRIRPTYVVIENVRGLLSAEYPVKGIKEQVKGGVLYRVLHELSHSGYTVSFELYNAENFGAPQSRERLIIIGKLGGERVPYLIPTNSDEPNDGLPRCRTLEEAFESLDINRGCHYIPYSPKRLRFFRMLREGEYWKNLPQNMWQEAMGEKLKLGGGKTGFYRRLSFNRPSPTLVTSPTMPATDLCHPIENRPLSIEEYRCIQEFPNEWEICGELEEQYRQVGNAVPIRLGEAIARAILNDSCGVAVRQMRFKYSKYLYTNDQTWPMKFEMNRRNVVANIEYREKIKNIMNCGVVIEESDRNCILKAQEQLELSMNYQLKKKEIETIDYYAPPRNENALLG